MKLPPITLACAVLLAASAAVAQDEAPAAIRFNQHIRPILSEYCFACHGPDSGARQADLRLDRESDALESGVIELGSAEESELIVRISSGDDDRMPPADFGKTLSAEHKQLLGRWIDAGAEWEPHWSFIRPSRPQLPEVQGAADWARNAIDHFVLQQAQLQGLETNGPERRHTLARRAALDITGLPPSQPLLDEFLADTRPDAYERYVDRLLASPHAGEHRARYWLDAARYGDTHGMHVDNYREIWPYRDWVVRAFNRGMPFDQFVVEQIAGDLLPRATLQQRIATGFNRCNITTSEGGAIPAEVEVRYMVDRVETTATVFLGLTAGCANCHDHKYDQLSHREFYQLGAFFNNTTQPPMDGNQKDTPPVVTLPAAEFAAEWDELQARRLELRNELGAWQSQPESWWSSRTPGAAELEPIDPDQLILSMPLVEDPQELLELPESARWAEDHPAGRRGVRFGEGGQLTAELPALRSDEPLTVSLWFRAPDRLMSTTLFDHTQKRDGKTVGWKITSSTQGAVTFQLTDAGGKTIRGLLPGEEALRPRSWQHLCIRYSGGQSNSSITILVDGEQRMLRNSTEDLVTATELADGPLKIATRVPTAGMSDLRIYRRWVSDEEVRLLARDLRLRELLAADAPWSGLSSPQRQLLTSFYNATADEGYRALSRQLSQTQRRRDFIYSRSTTTLVMQERPGAARAWVLQRGNYDQRREEVAPGVPAVLDFAGGFEPTGPAANRLDLARWLAHPEHPLTARVMVNRLWQSVFGVGLVKTTEDFGVMGERPSHGQLLDWLAVEFVESGWDVKHILKLIVTSATYRQSNVVSAEKAERDPENRYLARGPRVRLDAEVLRDQALAVSQLLQRDMGGPSVKPYQPAGLWKVVAITGSNTRVFQRDSGKALYRRSLYTFWKRTSPPPTMATFNAPTREQCTVRRERTNTPLQALVLLNDPQFVETARCLAEQAMRRHSDSRLRAQWLLATMLRGPAGERDVADIVGVADALQATFRQQPETAQQLIKTGDRPVDTELDPPELAAWTMAASAVMNRDDFINK